MHVVSFFVKKFDNIFRKYGLISYLTKIKRQAIIKLSNAKLKYPNTQEHHLHLFRRKDEGSERTFGSGFTVRFKTYQYILNIELRSQSIFQIRFLISMANLRIKTFVLNLKL